MADRILAVANSPEILAQMSAQSLDAVRPLTRPNILRELGRFMTEVQKLAGRTVQP
jgi:hypothetical protein